MIFFELQLAALGELAYAIVCFCEQLTTAEDDDSLSHEDAVLLRQVALVHIQCSPRVALVAWSL